MLFQVASRLVFTVFPCILILFGIIGKLAAVFITIPYPVLGGVQIIGFGMFIGLVMSNLQYIDIQSTRNLAIIGVSTLLGLMLPFWAKGNADGINTGAILNIETHFFVIKCLSTTVTTNNYRGITIYQDYMTKRSGPLEIKLQRLRAINKTNRKTKRLSQTITDIRNYQLRVSVID